MPAFTLLHTNDFHGKLDPARFGQLAAWRADCDLYFDTGDAINAGNLAIPLRPEPVWGRFAELKLTAGVIGNRETHVLESAFNAKLAGLSTPLLCANLRAVDGSRPLPGEMVFELGDARIGVFGVSVAMVTDRMKTRFASHYRWDPPLVVAAECVARLRPQVDVLIGLTHIGHRQDCELADNVAGIDILLTGHSHTVLPEPMRINQTWICQGGSHGRFAGMYSWEDGILTGGLRPLS